MDSIQEAADKIKLLGDKTRLTILTLLKEREWCVCEFVEILDMSQPGISQHLRKRNHLNGIREDSEVTVEENSVVFPEFKWREAWRSKHRDAVFLIHHK
ncbi:MULTISPECIES: metalloregulator ArsR/SmtB family transcription factor [Paenibacillus]|uniref:ArsR/SmtB family transcription factor n=1 Tax=Paenibacillus TaxID=44249 RepID=UPI0009FB421D|nr:MULTISPECIES: metalloregulator ArsR/SmtB family transcription factor [Paenibacillus]MBD8836950.1 winged helix-turn-helix transcriptional regulator [Paenibacillus sp. CFBP 13594]PRA07794.1 ArsR family transcriptional regulator [Paenibacillus sp. MYb63]PRA51438.1 ArsR family transcriptional regulator [Paenibacillus sp. MYb67]